MNDEHLFEAIVDAILFLELSGPATVDEDAAMGALEQIAARLQSLPSHERTRLVHYIQRRALTSHAAKETQGAGRAAEAAVSRADGARRLHPASCLDFTV